MPRVLPIGVEGIVLVPAAQAHLPHAASQPILQVGCMPAQQGALELGESEAVRQGCLCLRPWQGWVQQAGLWH